MLHRHFIRGFRRVPEERVPEGVLGYTHDKFIQGRPGLMKKIKKEVYVKKEKEEKEGDKKRPRKKARLKTPPQAAPEAAREFVLSPVSTATPEVPANVPVANSPKSSPARISS